MKLWIEEYKVEKTASGLLVASVDVPAPKSAFDAWQWKNASLAEICAGKWSTSDSTIQENLQKVKEMMPDTLYGIQVVYDGVESEIPYTLTAWNESAFIGIPSDSPLMAKHGAPTFSMWPSTHHRDGLATEYPKLRKAFERKLAKTPLARWAKEVGE